MPSPTLAGVMCELAGAYDAEAAGRRASGRLGGVHQVTCVSYVHGIDKKSWRAMSGTCFVIVRCALMLFSHVWRVREWLNVEPRQCAHHFLPQSVCGLGVESSPPTRRTRVRVPALGVFLVVSK